MATMAEILEKRCGKWTDDSEIGYGPSVTVGELRELIREAKAAREECAKVCDELAFDADRNADIESGTVDGDSWNSRHMALVEAAAAIRKLC